MRKIKNIKDVVDWGMCIGCGACYYACKNKAVRLVDIESQGIRPIVDLDKCQENCECLQVCPGYKVDAGILYDDPSDYKEGHELFGSALEIWEGYAADPDIRYSASSGGAITALALYCLENEGMKFTLHSGIDPENPLQNKTFKSYNKSDLISRAGSRYAPASPCDSLDEIEKIDGQCVFIGKPCDTAAVMMARAKNEKLRENLGLILTFFCAGAPSTLATKNLLNQMGVPLSEIDKLRYRGEGWPGEFKVVYGKASQVKKMSYKDSWHELQKFRSFRCHICPDGLGQMADISCGDAWHRYQDDDNNGLSILIARTEKGKKIIKQAIEAGYLVVKEAKNKDVLEAQGLLTRKPQVYGRLIALKSFLIPHTRFSGFNLFIVWNKSNLFKRIHTIVGSVKRIILKKLYKRKTLLK